MRVLLIVFVSVVLSVAVTALVVQRSDPQTLGDTVFERVAESGTLRCGYVNYPPAVVEEVGTGKLSGFAYDLVNRLGENLKWKVEWVEEVNPATMIEGLITDRYDMVCTPFWPNADRVKAADFTVGFYYSGMGLWVRTDDHRFDTDTAGLNEPSVTLSIMEGTTLAEIARQNFPRAKTLPIPDGAPVTDLVLNVATKKADAVIIDNYLAKEFAAANPGAIRQALNGQNLRVYSNAFMVKKGEAELQSVIDVALTELINSGYADDIITQYEKHPGTFLRLIRPYRELP